VTRFCDALNHLAGKNRQAQILEPIGAVLLDLFLPDSAGMEIIALGCISETLGSHCASPMRASVQTRKAKAP
jgi:hypothetical protein